MAKTNYNKMSEKTPKAPVNKVEENLETVEEVVTEAPVEEVPEEKIVYGVVSNCAKLNVRGTPSLKGEIVTVLNKGDEVEIEVSGERKDFYEVCALPGSDYFHGFCMKKYITVKK